MTPKIVRNHTTKAGQRGGYGTPEAMIKTKGVEEQHRHAIEVIIRATIQHHCHVIWKPDDLPARIFCGRVHAVPRYLRMQELRQAKLLWRCSLHASDDGDAAAVAIERPLAKLPPSRTIGAGWRECAQRSALLNAGTHCRLRPCSTCSPKSRNGTGVCGR